MEKYKNLKTGKICTIDQLKHLFPIAEHYGFSGSFDDWINYEIQRGSLVPEKMNLQGILEYALQVNRMFDLEFIHDNGKKFQVLDAKMGLFSMENKFCWLKLNELESYYKDAAVFSIV